MQAETRMIDFSFKYPVDCTREQLRQILVSVSQHWPGWEEYPWRITRNIHRFIDTPPVNFHYLMVQHCVAAHASHVILKGKFEDRNDVLDMLIREQFQFVGVFRQMLIDALRYEMRFSKVAYIPDCTGPEDGHTNVPDIELKERRNRYRGSIECAEYDFARILNTASLTEGMDGWMNGRPLKIWARGGDMPDPVSLQVRVFHEDGKTVLLPSKMEAAAMARAGKSVLRLELATKTARSLGIDQAAHGGYAAASHASSSTGDDSDDDNNESRNLVGAALTLAQALDGKPRVKAPTHIMVLKMYCLDGLSVLDIQKKCRCGHGTVMSRKKSLETKLGQPLESFRKMSGIFAGMAATLEDGRAKEIYRKGLVDGREEE